MLSTQRNNLLKLSFRNPDIPGSVLLMVISITLELRDISSQKLVHVSHGT